MQAHDSESTCDRDRRTRQAPELTLACAGPENEEIVKLSVAPAPDHVAVDYECLMPGIAVCSVVFKFQMWKVRATAAHRSEVAPEPCAANLRLGNKLST